MTNPKDPADPTRPDPGRLRNIGPVPSRAQAQSAPPEGTVFVSNDDLLRFVDGALDDDGRVRVLTHLATRPAAVERVEAYLHQNARLRTLGEHLPLTDSAAFEAPLQAALVARLSRDRKRRNWKNWGAAAAVALLVAGGAIGLEPWQSRTPTTSETPMSTAMTQAFFLFEKPELTALTPVTAADAHAVAEAAPTALSVDDAAFDWLAGQVSDFSVKAPDFDRIGLELVGGETLERHGTPAIRLVYQDEAAKPVLLYVGIGKPDANHAFWLVREGYVSLQWRRGPMVFALVAPTDSPQLSHVVDLVSAAVARLPAPERAEPTEVTTQGDAAAAESGPVQAIAVPVTPPAPTIDQPVEPSNRAPAEILPEAKDTNQPEPL
jgi:anti-sigma factor RsiW